MINVNIAVQDITPVTTTIETTVTVEDNTSSNTPNDDETVTVEVSGGAFTIYELLILFLLMMSILIMKTRLVNAQINRQ